VQGSLPLRLRDLVPLLLSSKQSPPVIALPELQDVRLFLAVREMLHVRALYSPFPLHLAARRALHTRVDRGHLLPLYVGIFAAFSSPLGSSVLFSKIRREVVLILCRLPF